VKAHEKPGVAMVLRRLPFHGYTTGGKISFLSGFLRGKTACSLDQRGSSVTILGMGFIS
jgi:hypothetical protein